MIFIRFKHGNLIVEIVHSNSEGAQVRVVVPYKGTSDSARNYYTEGKQFWTNLEDTLNTTHKEITKEENPEYFL